MILVDPREGSGELLPKLLAKGLPAELTTLESGDFAFAGKDPQPNGSPPLPIFIGIERKVLMDLVTSMRTKRLSRQSARMVQQYEKRYILVEGGFRVKDGVVVVKRADEWRPLGWGQPILYSQIHNYLTTLEEEAGFRIRWAMSPRDSVEVIGNLYARWQKEKHDSLLGFYTAPMPPLLFDGREAPKCAAFASRLTGVGWVMAKRIAAKFGSVDRMCQATESEWLEIEGIGKLMARQAMAELREVWEP